jgi:putative inorganic carbon (HCO3(-)) transporter
MGIGVALFAVVEVVTFMQAYLNHTLKIGIADAAFGINPNSVAIYLEPLLALAAGFALFGRGLWRLGASALLILLVVAEVMTLSRGGLLAMAMLALIAFLTLRSALIKLAVVAAGLVGAVVVWQLPLIGMRLTYFRLDPSGTLYGREHIWSSTLKMLIDHPIFGAGVGAYQAAMAPYRAADTYQVPEPYAHNIVLTTWSETGLLGLVAFFWILALLVIRPWRAFGRAVGFHRPLVWGLGAAFAMIAVHGLVDSPYWKNDLSLEFWILAALEVVALRAVASLPVEHV